MAVTVAIVAYSAWMAISSVFAAQSDIAWAATELQLKILLPFLVGITTIRTVNQLKQLAWMIFSSEAYLALELNQRYFSSGGSFINWFRENGFGGMDNNCMGIAMVAATGLAFFLALSAD